MRQFFVKRPKFLAATSNLLVQQNLVHVRRFLHFSQKVVGVTLSVIDQYGVQIQMVYVADFCHFNHQKRKLHTYDLHHTCIFKLSRTSSFKRAQVILGYDHPLSKMTTVAGTIRWCLSMRKLFPCYCHARARASQKLCPVVYQRLI